MAPGGPRLYGLEKFWALLHYAHNVPPYCDIEVHPTVRCQRKHVRPALVHMCSFGTHVVTMSLQLGNSLPIIRSVLQLKELLDTKFRTLEDFRLAQPAAAKQPQAVRALCCTLPCDGSRPVMSTPC